MWSASENFIQFVSRPPYGLSLSEADARLISPLPIAQRAYPAGVMVVEEEQTRRGHIFIASGWAYSYRSMANGHRVVHDFLQRGDFLGAHEAPANARLSVEARTDVVTYEIEAPRCVQSPRLVGLIFRLFARNCRVADEHLANIARLAPQQRLSSLLLEVAYRREQAALGPGQSFDFPFTQRDLGDSLGLTAIHINRLLRLLREQQYLRFQHWRLEFLDQPTLTDIAGFSPGYLSFGS
jgi:CRP-like cAMP-binding protein